MTQLKNMKLALAVLLLSVQGPAPIAHADAGSDLSTVKFGKVILGPPDVSMAVLTGKVVMVEFWGKR